MWSCVCDTAVCVSWCVWCRVCDIVRVVPCVWRCVTPRVCHGVCAAVCVSWCMCHGACGATCVSWCVWRTCGAARVQGRPLPPTTLARGGLSPHVSHIPPSITLQLCRARSCCGLPGGRPLLPVTHSPLTTHTSGSRGGRVRENALGQHPPRASPRGQQAPPGPVRGQHGDAGLLGLPLLTGAGLPCLGPAECDRLRCGHQVAGLSLCRESRVPHPLSRLDRDPCPLHGAPRDGPLSAETGRQTQRCVGNAPPTGRGDRLHGGGQLDAQTRPAPGAAGQV